MWRLLVRYRDYRLLLAAGLASVVGDWILLTGLGYQVYRITGSTLATAGLVLTALVPLLLGSVAGVAADRWSRRGTMFVTNLLLAAGLLPLLVVRHPGQVWIVYLVTVFEAAAAQFFAPARDALLPTLVDRGDLVTANALNGPNRNLGRLIGAALGGVVVAWGGLAAVTLADLASFVVAAGLIALLRATAPPDRVRRAGSAAAGAVRDWLAGLRAATTGRQLRVVLGFLTVTSIGDGIMDALMVPFVRGVLHGDGPAFGTILSVQAVGGIAGGFAVAALAGRRAVPPRLLLGGGAVLFGALDLALFLYPLASRSLWPAGVIMVVVGLPGAAVGAGTTTLVQTGADDAHRGRVFGALATTAALGQLVGTVAAGALGDAVGVLPVITVQGAGYLLAGLAVLALLRPAPGPDIPTGAGIAAERAPVSARRPS